MYAKMALIAARSCGVPRNCSAVRRELVVDGMALLVRGPQNAQRLLVLLVHLAARQVGRADLVRDRPQIVEPRLDRAPARRRTMLAKVIANAGDGIASA